MKISVDIDGVMKNLGKLNVESSKWAAQALSEMADTLLVLSRAEIPVQSGRLTGTGNAYQSGQMEYSVSYNTTYAAYQHEGIRRDGTHVIRNRPGGGKSKFLEDPLKMNLSTWQNIYARELAKHL